MIAAVALSSKARLGTICGLLAAEVEAAGKIDPVVTKAGLIRTMVARESKTSAYVPGRINVREDTFQHLLA